MQKNKNISFHIGDRVKIYDIEVERPPLYGTIATLDRTKESLSHRWAENRIIYPVGVILDEENPGSNTIFSYSRNQAIQSESWAKGYGVYIWIGRIEEIQLDVPMVCVNCAVKCKFKKERTKCPIIKSYPTLR